MQAEQVEQKQALDKDVIEAFTFSEFINTIKCIRSEDDFKNLKPLGSTPEEELENISSYHFSQLAIQFFYLLYSCFYKKIVPISEDNDKFLCFNPEKNTLYLCVRQFVTFQTSEIRKFQSKSPYFTYYKNFSNAIHPYWNAFEKKSRLPIKKQGLTADYFAKKLNEINQIQFSSQQEAFKIFQKAEFFIYTSILLRIRNSSVVCVFRKNAGLLESFKKHVNLEKKLSQEYNERRRVKKNIEKIMESERKIEKNIEEFFMGMKRNPQYYKVKDKTKNELSFSSNNGMNKLQIGLKVYELSETQRNPKPNPNEIQDDFNMYELEYSSNKNMIVVKMVTDLVLDMGSSDSILFKWNTLTFETSNIGIETIEELDDQKRPKKLVVVRGTSYFNRKEPVIEKILTLMDITMAMYKSIQLEMVNQAFFTKNLNKIEESYAKINHYIKAIHKCCTKYYSFVLKEENPQI